MLFFIYLLTFVFHLLANAQPHATALAAVSGKALDARQIISANPSVNCCIDCATGYGYSTYWHVFDDFCTWAGNGLELWTMQSYSTGNYYCKSGSSVCIHLMVQYLCSAGPDGSGNAAQVNYKGCMDYFDFAITPVHACGGPPYPGAHIESSDHCWIFQATSDSPNTAKTASHVALDCDDSGRYCYLPGTNKTLPAPQHKFGSS